MGAGLNAQQPPLPPGQEPLPPQPGQIVLQPNGIPVAPPLPQEQSRMQFGRPRPVAPPPPPEMGIVDAVRNPNFDSAMNRQIYTNLMEEQRARIDANSRATQAQVPPMPQVGSNITQMEPIPSQGEINKRMEFINKLNGNQRIQEFSRTPPPQIPIQQLPLANIPFANQLAQPIPQMQQMQNYNQMLQQGMQRNQDMNQAVQNFAAPAGPAKSFSQVVGGIRRMNRTPRQPRNNFLAPSNQKLI